MFDSYSEIFDERGQLYHQAMLDQPRARDREFEEVVRIADVSAGQRICDAPAGGGYLRRHLPADVRLVSLETAPAFASLSAGNDAPDPLLASLGRLPFASGSFDRVVSAAALHHVEDKLAFHREAHRVLESGGALCVADVWVGSFVANFLDGFVDAHSRMGHAGMYLDEKYAALLEDAGLRVDAQERVPFVWSFDDVAAMTSFTRLLFGIDDCSDEELHDGIETMLGVEQVGGRCEMQWELAFFRAIKA